MRTLLHSPFDPISRQVRLILYEKNITFQSREFHPLDQKDDILAVNPAGTLPVLIDEPPTGGEIAVSPTNAIAEYLEEAYPLPALMPATSAGRAEMRRLNAWFCDKFAPEISSYLTYEFIEKRLKRLGQPDTERLRAGQKLLDWHLDYINYLCEHRSWLAGNKMTIADLYCAAHLSCLDYCDLIQWRNYNFAKEWYAKIKSRPSFKPLLLERVPGLPAARHYDNLDF